MPEWLPPEKMDIDIAERLIEYKIKMSEQWLESPGGSLVGGKTTNESKPIKLRLRVIAKVRKKHLNKPKQKNK